MPNFYEYNPEQANLLPPSVRDARGKIVSVSSCIERWRSWICESLRKPTVDRFAVSNFIRPRG